MTGPAERLIALASQIQPDGTLPEEVMPSGYSLPGGQHPDLAAHDLLGLATQAELETHAGTVHGTQPHAISGVNHTGTLDHSALANQTANQHHSQAHAIGGADHSGQLAYSALASIPATFPPAAHAHPESEVTNLVVDLAGKAASGHNHDATYAAIGHTHPGGSAPTVVRATSQQDITVAGFVSTALAFAVTAGRFYRFRAWIAYRSSTTAMGVLFAYSGPAMTMTMIRSGKQVTAGGTPSSDMFSEAILTANDAALPVATAEIAQAVNLLQIIEGTFSPSANGTFAIRFSKENVAGTASVMPGSWIEYQDIT